MYEIKKGVPIPDRPKGGGRDSKYPFGSMVDGDMVEVPIEAGETVQTCLVRIRSAAQAWRNRNGKHMSFVVRSVDENGEPFFDDYGFQVLRMWSVAS